MKIIRKCILILCIVIAFTMSFHIAYSVGAKPVVEVISYDGETLKVKITPNGAEKINIYNGTTKLTTTALDTKGVTDSKEFDILYKKTGLASQVINVQAERNANNTGIVIKWEDSDKKANKLNIIAKDKDHPTNVSETVEYIINSLETITIKRYNETGLVEDIVYRSNITDNFVEIPLLDITWNSAVTIESRYKHSTDTATDPEIITKIVTQDTINGLIYTTKITGLSNPEYDAFSLDQPDKIEARTFQNIILRQMLNWDIIDPAYGIEEIEYTFIDQSPADMTVSVVDYSSVGGTEIEEGNGGKLVTFYTSTDTPSKIRIGYRYKVSRSDIPEDRRTGYIEVNIIADNKAPIANTDTIDTSKPDSPVKMVNGVIDIPFNELLKNDEDDGGIDNLTIDAVSSVNIGTIELIKDLRIVRLTPLMGYNGNLIFSYGLRDSLGKTSVDMAQVRVLIRSGQVDPIANPIEVYMQLSEQYKAISLSVTNKDGVAYQLKNNGITNIKVNGQSVGNTSSSIYKFTLTPSEIESSPNVYTPYIKMQIGNNTKFKNDDILTFQYTISFESGGKTKTSTALATIKMTTGDDPDDNEGYLYVHRRPLALYSLDIKKSGSSYYVDSINLTSEFSYDLDHQMMHRNSLPAYGTDGDNESRPIYSWNGLRSWEWGVKVLKNNTTSGQWKTKTFDAYGVISGEDYDGTYTLSEDRFGGSAELARDAGLKWVREEISKAVIQNKSDPGLSILISLRVRDVDGPDKKVNGQSKGPVGVWSEQYVISASSTASPPVAYFITDSSTYTVPLNPDGTSKPLAIQVTDLSHDPNGNDDITLSTWDMTYPDGTTQKNIGYFNGTGGDVSNIVTELVNQYVKSHWSTYGKKGVEFTLKLKVKDKTNLEDEYSYTFKVYKENQPPKVTDDKDPSGGSPLGNLDTAIVYEEDRGLDGVKFDTLGLYNNGTGRIQFNRLFRVIDDQDVSTVTIDWRFEGEAVTTRKDWSEDRLVITEIAAQGGCDLSGRPTEPTKFSGQTVSTLNMKPGAYKIYAEITDHPNTSDDSGFASTASKTTYWNTFGAKAPFHLYEIPALDIEAEVQLNEWKMVRDTSIAGTSNNGTDGFNYQTLRYKWINLETGEEVKDTDYDRLEDLVPTIGDIIKIKVTTNKYVTKLWAYEDTDNNNKLTYKDASGVKKYNELGTPTSPLGTQFNPDTDLANYALDKETDNYIPLEKMSENLNNTITWEGEYEIEEVVYPEDADNLGMITSGQLEHYLTSINLRIHAETIWGREDQDENKPTRIKEIPASIVTLPIKLYDFRITELTDPSLSDLFNTYVQKCKDNRDLLDNGSITNGVLVGHLALESEDLTSLDIPEAKKGYSFYFELNSKGLKKDADQVRIYPRFYAVNDNDEIMYELDGYVPGRTGKFVKYTNIDSISDAFIKDTYALYYQGSKTNSLNSHSEVIISTDLRKMEDGNPEQIWYGRYGIPSDAKFFKQGSSEISLNTEYNGRILVTFEIQAWKDGIECKYNYVEKKQWLKERQKIVDPNKLQWTADEEQWFNTGTKSYTSSNPIGGWQGAVIVYNSSINAMDDYTSNPIWRE